jgi:hypothetical protein
MVSTSRPSIEKPTSEPLVSVSRTPSTRRTGASGRAARRKITV